MISCDKLANSCYCFKFYRRCQQVHHFSMMTKRRKKDTQNNYKSKENSCCRASQISAIWRQSQHLLIKKKLTNELITLSITLLRSK
ncbi:CLUMA_CG003545, isoform A [Clunio marinus]|uniref:CLUMA_CG003545, isoform A n=1 Tax=Clunio marinus TaxID=568069 RepID=A0A1J1HQT2_9DIPT|nr:CLUMA_CG003545, isoform A [Clunio marinus]